MSRSDLERLSKEELIEPVLKLHRPEKTSRTSSKPPATDRKERREKSRPGGAKPGHEGHKRALTPDPDQVVGASALRLLIVRRAAAGRSSGRGRQRA